MIQLFPPPPPGGGVLFCSTAFRSRPATAEPLRAASAARPRALRARVAGLRPAAAPPPLSAGLSLCGLPSVARLVVPEKNFALLACSFFPTTTGAPSRCIRHRRRSTPHPFGRPPCGTRKELRAARLLVLSDHYGCSVSLYPPPAALDSAPLRSPALWYPKRTSRYSPARFSASPNSLPCVRDNEVAAR